MLHLHPAFRGDLSIPFVLNRHGRSYGANLVTLNMFSYCIFTFNVLVLFHYFAYFLFCSCTKKVKVRMLIFFRYWTVLLWYIINHGTSHSSQISFQYANIAFFIPSPSLLLPFPSPSLLLSFSFPSPSPSLLLPCSFLSPSPIKCE